MVFVLSFLCFPLFFPHRRANEKSAVTGCLSLERERLGGFSDTRRKSFPLAWYQTLTSSAMEPKKASPWDVPLAAIFFVLRLFCPRCFAKLLVVANAEKQRRSRPVALAWFLSERAGRSDHVPGQPKEKLGTRNVNEKSRQNQVEWEPTTSLFILLV